MGSARNLVRTAHGGAHRAHRRCIVEAQQQQRARLVRRRQDFYRDLVEHRQCAPGAGQQLGEIVAGDVLHHLAARLEGLAASVDAAEAQQVIARRTGRQPPRPGEISHDGADQCPLPGFPAEQRPEVGRLEGQHLVALRQQRLDLADRRASTQRDHQLLRGVIDDAAQAGEIEDLAAAHRPSEGARRVSCRHSAPIPPPAEALPATAA